MASWKTKGYVSDSEDDDILTAKNTRGKESPRLIGQGSVQIDRSLPSTNLCHPAGYEETQSKERLSFLLSELRRPTGNPKDNTNHDNEVEEKGNQVTQQLDASSTANELQKTLENGIQAVRDVLARSQSPELLFGLSDDSPLSTPPDSPVPENLLPTTVSGHHIALTEPSITIHAAQRTLRQRSAIQQHPYSLEYARYVQRCNERGVKPVSLPRLAAAAEAHRGDESQDSHFETDSQEDGMASSTNVRRGLEPSSSPDVDVDDEMLDDILPLDDLVDLTSLLESKPNVGSATKKSYKLLSKPNRSILRHLPSEAWKTTTVSSKTPRRDSGSVLSKIDQQNSFPSPPYSNATISVDSHQEIEYSSRDSSPRPLPTPILSSEIRRRKRPVIEDDSQSVSDIQPADTSESESGNESLDLEPQALENVGVMKKRVRGVLPASWWSIDRVRQEISKKKVVPGGHNRTVPEAGVAQRKKQLPSAKAVASEVLAHLYEDLVSDEEGEDTVNPPRPTFTISLPNLENEKPSISSEGLEAFEAIDDDGVDPMLPPQSRSHRTKFFAQNRYRPSPDSKTPTHRRNAAVDRQLHRPKNDKLRSKTKRGLKRLKRGPNDLIHIFDAPGLDPSSEVSKPAFLRVAARQAKTRGQDRGTSAAAKFIHLISDDEFLETQHARHRPSHRLELSFADGKDTRKVSDSSYASTAGPLQKSTIKHMSAEMLRKSAPRQRSGQELQGRQGTTILCQPGSDRVQEKRITRLRSMLPVANRSGAGHFDRAAQLTRAAQAEILVTPRRKLMLPKKPHRSPVSFRNESQSGVTTNAGASDHDQDQIRSANAKPSAIRRAPRKQTPSRYVASVQKTLVPHEPDSARLEGMIGKEGLEVRAALEQNFSEYQNAWFQGSGAGFTAVNQRTQRHFHTFLEVLRSYLTDSLHDSDDGLSNRDLPSFLHRLVPNRGYIGAKGQAGNKSLDVYELDIIVARNVFELHACLLGLAPACAPRPRVLEMKVNFSDAHHEICMVALSTWHTILTQHHTDPTIVDGLGRWIYAMVFQLIQRWRSAEADAQAEANASTLHVDQTLIRSVISRNREQTCKLLNGVLSSLREGIENATGQLEANSLFNIESFQYIIGIVSQMSELSDGVVETFLRVPEAFVQQRWYEQQPSVVQSILQMIKTGVANLFANNVRSPKVVTKATDVYFALARCSVALHLKTWDDFMEPRSSLCPEMFLTGKVLQSITTGFLARLVEHDFSQYALEFRAQVMKQWFHTLYSIHSDVDATVSLTFALLNMEKQSLGMHELAGQITSASGGLLSETLMNRLPSIRHDVAMHVIKSVHDQEDDPEGDWMPGGLEPNDCVQLLRVMFQSMKESWLSLEFRPEDQGLFMNLIHSALDQYETYPRQDFSIDPWFYNSATFPQRRKKTLVQILCSPHAKTSEAITQASEHFVAEAHYAKRKQQFVDLQTQLDALFSTLIPLSFQNEDAPVLDPRITFMSQTFPEYLNKESEEWIPLRTMLLHVLGSVVENLECYVDCNNRDNAGIGIGKFMAIIPLLESKMAVLHDIERRLVFDISRMIYLSAVGNGGTLPQQFLENIDSICDYAAADDSEAALSFLASLMSFV